MCRVNFNLAEKICYTFLSLACGILAVGGNLALLVALNRTSMVGPRVNDYFIGSLAFADFMIGLTLTPLYACYVLVSVDLSYISFRGSVAEWLGR